jgi:hypothetical protein
MDVLGHYFSQMLLHFAFGFGQNLAPTPLDCAGGSFSR